MTPKSYTRLLSIALTTALSGLCSAENGLVDWTSKQELPPHEAAMRFIEDSPGMLRVLWRPVGTEKWEDELTGWKRMGEGLVAGDDRRLFTVSARFFNWQEALRLRVTLTANRAAEAPTEVLLRCPFDPKAWDRQFVPRLPYLILSPSDPAILRFAVDATDATTFAQAPQVAFYPFAVLENRDAMLLWGCPDVGRYAVLNPNAISASAPCLSLRPKQLAVGQKLEFDLILKRFDKPRLRYRDVLSWYLRSAFSSDPLVKDLFPWDGKMRARRLPEGNLGSGIGRLGERWNDGARLLQEMRLRHVGGLWFQGWGPWDETYPTDGEWWTEYWLRLSAKQVRDEIEWERANGISPLLYCRQFVAEQGLHDDRPPRRNWSGRDENGNRQAWGDVNVPESVATELGFRVLQQSCADFGNSEYLAWYEDRVKQCVTAYNPAGIAWDMGWGAGPTWGYSRANPQVMNGDGMLRAQADLWDWLKTHHPEKRTISNEAFGTPSQLFSDGILIEGGFAAGKTELDYEAAKALDTTIISYEYPHVYAARLKGLPTSSARYVQMRYRAEGLDTKSDRYVVYPSQEVVGKEGTAIACSQLVSDGQWHVATFDMRGLPNVEEVKGLAFGMQSAAPEAHLWVASLRFSDTPDGPALAGLQGSFPTELMASGVAAWEPRPGWVADGAPEYGVRSSSGCVEFWVRGAARGMSWSYFPACADLAQEYLKVLSLGACIGSGPRGGWNAVNAFSARAMALAPLVGSHDVTLQTEEAGLNASGWGSDGRLLLAAHNGTQQSAKVRVRISTQALQQAKASIGPRAVSRLVGASAETTRPGPEAESSDEGLTVAAELGPGEALLWGNWPWE